MTSSSPIVADVKAAFKAHLCLLAADHVRSGKRKQPGTNADVTGPRWRCQGCLAVHKQLPREFLRQRLNYTGFEIAFFARGGFFSVSSMVLDHYQLEELKCPFLTDQKLKRFNYRLYQDEITAMHSQGLGPSAAICRALAHSRGLEVSRKGLKAAESWAATTLKTPARSFSGLDADLWEAADFLASSPFVVRSSVALMSGETLEICQREAEANRKEKDHQRPAPAPGDAPGTSFRSLPSPAGVGGLFWARPTGPQLFRHYPRCIAFDGTHGSNRNGGQLYSFTATDAGR
jgi:hypothetical protein